MAGEFEDCIGFQDDCLPSGSISFGRFEAESLSWERRSSFSHNRYLEEVEKYSTPGSVTQKKAYFEAHFKKNPLLRRSSSDSQNEAEYQTTENLIKDHMNYMEEFVNHGDEEQLEFSWYDVKPVISGEREHEVMECDCGEESLCSEFQPTLCNGKAILDSSIELLEHEETLPTQSEFDTMPSDKDGTYILVEEKPTNEARTEDGLSVKTDTSSKSQLIEKDNASSLKKTQEASLKVKAKVEQKPTKAKLRTQGPVEQIPRKTSTEKYSFSSSNAFRKTSRKVERENPFRTKTEKQTPFRVQPPLFSDSKNLKSEDPESLKAKLRQENRQENRSEKGMRAKKDGVIPQSISEKSEIEVPQSGSRPKRVVNSAKVDIKQSGSVFNFKSDERAEKRKEFYMRLEEKLHAKEVEINQIQTRTQEEIEAEIKQFRRSLNFKAKPMPSFYHEALPRDSDGKKIVVESVKSAKLRGKCTSPGHRTTPQENCPASSKLADQGGPSSSVPGSSTQLDCPMASELDTGCTMPANQPDKTNELKDGNSIPQSAKKIDIGKKGEKVKHNVQQQQGNGEVKNVERTSKTKRGGVGKVQMDGKVIKGMGGGNLAVHVAS